MTPRILPSTGTKPGSKAWHGARGTWPTTEDGQLIITQSMVTAFVQCPRETYYSIILGLRPRIESKPLTRGTWIHALLEEYASGGNWKTPPANIIDGANERCGLVSQRRSRITNIGSA